MTRAKTGGRTKGTPNKRTQDLKDRIEALGCDPLIAMVQIGEEAKDKEDWPLAFNVYRELMQYCYPKRRAVEIEATIEAAPMPIQVAGVSAQDVTHADV